MSPINSNAISAKLSAYSSGSAAKRILVSTGRMMRRLVRFSAIWKFFAMPERTTALFYKSASGKIIASVPDTCTRKLKQFGVFLNRSLENTLTLWILSWFAERFDLLFLLFVAAHALIPYALYHNPYTIAALAVLLFSACARVALTRSKSATFSMKRIDPVFLLYFLAIAASSAYSAVGAGRGAASLTTSVLYLVAVFFAILIANAYFEHGRLLLLIKVIIGTAVIVSAYGILQYLRGIPPDVTQTDLKTGGASLAMGRADSTLGNPNVLAAWLLLVIPFSVSMFFMARNPIRKLLAFFITMPMIVCLLLTQSRSGWLGLFAAGVVFIFLLDWRLLPLFAAAGFLSIPFWPAFILDRLMIAGSDTSSVYRYTIYAGAFRMAVSNFATGIRIGLEYFKRYINNYVYFAYQTAPVHSHMLALQIWLESGVVALLSFFWAMARLIKKGGAYIFSHKQKRYPKNAGVTLKPDGTAYEMRLILTACVSAVIGFLAMGCFEYVWFFPRCMNHFFMIIGIFYCAVNLSASNGTQGAAAG